MSAASSSAEKAACTLPPLYATNFNPAAVIPYGCTVEHVRSAMNDFLDFLSFINGQLHTKGTPRLETFLMPANFSSIVGEYMTIAIPKYCPGLAKNNYHNGHPDMLPSGVYPGDSKLHAAKCGFR